MVTPLRENHLASMPPETLHADTHDVLKSHGYELLSAVGGVRHRYRHPEKGGIEWAYDQGFDPDNNEDPPQHPGQQIHQHLPALGWKRNKSADFDFDHEHGNGEYDSHIGIVYDHPNGSRLTMREREKDEEETEYHAHLDYPRRAR